MFGSSTDWGYVLAAVATVLVTLSQYLQGQSHIKVTKQAIDAVSTASAESTKAASEAAAALAAGGGTGKAATPASWPLTALPRWQQTGITLPDGSHDPQMYNDCGETCVACIIAAGHGVPVSPGSVRANFGGVTRSGLTTGTDLVGMLAYYNYAAESQQVAARDIIARLGQWTKEGHPTIVLGTFPRPGGVLHWMTTIAADGQWFAMNPWTGLVEGLSWDVLIKVMEGTVVVCTGTLHYDMQYHALPM